MGRSYRRAEDDRQLCVHRNCALIHRLTPRELYPASISGPLAFLENLPECCEPHCVVRVAQVESRSHLAGEDVARPRQSTHAPYHRHHSLPPPTDTTHPYH